MSNWTITNTLPEQVSSRDMDEVMADFAETIEQAMHRYEPAVRIDAFDLLIERLTEERESLFDHLISDRRKLTE